MSLHFLFVPWNYDGYRLIGKAYEDVNLLLIERICNVIKG